MCVYVCAGVLSLCVCVLELLHRHIWYVRDVCHLETTSHLADCLRKH